MSDEKIISELAAEVTICLLSIAPGSGTIIDILPDTSKRLVRKLFGADQTDSLRTLIETTLNSIASGILSQRNASPGSPEYGATMSGIADFKDSLRATRLDARMLIDALVDPTTLEARLWEHTPEEHKSWASSLRRDTYRDVLREFTVAIVDLAPQAPAVQTALAIEILKEVRSLRRQSQNEP